ncbi:SUMO-activating enzyme subunit 1-like [Centruroides sculpturatus]|uniref:SUMO-activating enzyme subunit 1-like n=1 Tax=Centruroides sculpturatus TaxID=218467 RepID=UPI000C6D75DB|nr:SUMO-activating enzyme subunit 1-like [Centruroides sculpturatus]
MADIGEFEITEDEAELYDRQIRLWGLDAQKRLRSSNILLIGINSLGGEVAKNLVLAGVKSLTIMDNNKVSELDTKLQFLFSSKDIGKNRAEVACQQLQLLNPMVEVTPNVNSVEDINNEFFLSYNVVCIISSNTKTLIRLNNLCRKHEKKFFCGDVWGFYGYCFLDLNHHSYVEERATFTMKQDCKEPKTKKLRTEEKTTQIITKSVDFTSLEKALAAKAGKFGTALNKQTSSLFFLLHVIFKFWEINQRYPQIQSREDDINKLLQLKDQVMKELSIDSKRLEDQVLMQVFGELSPVSAVVGGVLAQEVIKAVSCKDNPIKNFFLFHGKEGGGVVENIGR